MFPYSIVTEIALLSSLLFDFQFVLFTELLLVSLYNSLASPGGKLKKILISQWLITESPEFVSNTTLTSTIDIRQC